ncbi:unnamed protein product [Moneuplotes crassus]|uniref:Uncharacterized protein n=1 Tax=Euplotes crassus TaxID=5936 RepID=A0AAD1XXD9_EUPCR|nr:unnamed protein product [Moneuplotes crassus]
MGNRCLDSKSSGPDLKDHKKKDSQNQKKDQQPAPKPVISPFDEELQRNRLKMSDRHVHSELERSSSNMHSNVSMAAFAKRNNQSPNDTADYNNLNVILTTSNYSKAGVSFRPKDASMNDTSSPRIATFLNQTQSGQIKELSNYSKDQRFSDNNFSKSRSNPLSSQTPSDHVILEEGEEEKIHF